MRPLLTRERRCPERPTRWSAAATVRGDCTCTTRSIAPTSIPSSSDDVATSARSFPSFRRFSASRRARRDSEPWWAATRPSPTRSFRSRASRSAERRLWAKTSVVRCAATSSAICCSAASQIVSLCAVRKSSTGVTTRTSSCRAKPASTTAGSRTVVPVRNASASSTGLTVAEHPMRCGRAPGSWASTSACKRSSDSARCAPRLLPIMAWISSTITKRVCASAGRKRSAVRRMKSDSGVVIRMWGGRRVMACRAAASVSPVRTATRTSGRRSPASAAAARMPWSGSRRFFSMSLFSARSGET